MFVFADLFAVTTDSNHKPEQLEGNTLWLFTEFLGVFTTRNNSLMYWG